MAVAILPAAGASRRMGRPKLLLPFRGGTVIGSLLVALREGGVEEIVLVTAPGDRDLQTWGETEGVRVAVNPEPERGMLSTILCGLAACGGAAGLAARGEILLVSPADLPALRASTVAAVLRRAARGPRPLTVPRHGGRRGHPLAIAPALIPEIEALDPGAGLRALLELHPDGVSEVEVDDPGAVRDLDTPEEYRALAAEVAGP